VSYTVPRLNPRAAKKTARTARMGRPRRSASSKDTVDLLSHAGALATWYREEFLPSPLGGLLRDGLAGETNALADAVRTGDLEEIVEWR